MVSLSASPFQPLFSILSQCYSHATRATGKESSPGDSFMLTGIPAENVVL